jgi:putative DNA primase/helicase
MVLPVILNSIPEEIKRFKNWVLWRLEERDGKNTKIPYQRNGRRADTTNPDTWDTFDYIQATRTKSNGIGFVFSEDTGIVGADWDKVRDPETGEWDKEALAEILSLGSYAELSQSGTGAHVLIKGKIPGDRRRKGNLEMYCKERYFVVTGQRIEGTPTEIKENQEAINKLYETRFREDKKEGKKSQPVKEQEKKLRSPNMSDEEVLDHCRKAANSEKFIKLYDKGEWREFKYPSKSEASLGLCVYMAFYTQDIEQINRIYYNGKLYDSDWDRDSKGLATIKTAISGLTAVWNPKEYKKKENKGDGLYPYVLTENGVEKYIDIKDPEDPSKTKTIMITFIFSPVKITALSDDLDGEKILYKISIDHPVNGHIEIWKDQGELLTRGGINKLLSEGLTATDSSYKDITQYFLKDILRAASEAKKELIAQHAGWKRDKTIFVVGNEAYTSEGVIPVNLTNKDVANAFRKAGTLEGWINGCEWILQYPCTRINCYTAGSAVVAGYLEQPSPIQQNQGITTSGKTLKSAVAVSLVGDPSELVKSADTTLTGAERHAMATSGTCTVYDEIGLLKNPDGLTYLLSNGRKKNRGTKEGLEANGHWFKSFILNGEFDFLKESAAQGEIGRLIKNPGKLPTDAVNAKRTEIEIKEHFGHIMPLFMAKFFSKMDTIKDRYTALCSKLPDSDVDIGSRLKDSFALIIIAGEILEEVFEDIGIKKMDAYSICEELYLENISSERVQPYWIRGLKIINDELNVCKQIYDNEGGWTDAFVYKGQLAGIRELEGVFIDILPATFNDICEKHGLKHQQLATEWRENGITEVDKIDKRGKQSNQKTIRIDGDPKKVVRLIKSKVYETLGIEILDTVSKAILIEHIVKHWVSFQSACEEETSQGFAHSFVEKYPIHKKHTQEAILQLLKESLSESNT